MNHPFFTIHGKPPAHWVKQRSSWGGGKCATHSGVGCGSGADLRRSQLWWWPRVVTNEGTTTRGYGKSIYHQSLRILHQWISWKRIDEGLLLCMTDFILYQMIHVGDACVHLGATHGLQLAISVGTFNCPSGLPRLAPLRLSLPALARASRMGRQRR